MPTSATNAQPLDHAGDETQHALRAFERIHDPASTRRLEALGVGPGWRCLEVGAGGGSITRWLCSKVGPAGRVLAVDIDTRFVGGIRSANLDVARLDVTTVALPAASFDLVHARALLSCVPEPGALLDRLVTTLAPGGRLLIEEPHDITADGDPAGHDSAWAADLPRHLAERGLSDLGVDSDTTSEVAMIAVWGFHR